MKKYIKYLIPPIILILIGFLISLIFNSLIGSMSWIALVIVYWSGISIIVYRDSKKSGKRIKEYFKMRNFRWYLILLALLVGIIPLPIFLISYKLFTTTFLIVSWLLVALINPFFEELFWRGYMLEKGEDIRFGIKALISSVLFTLSHPAMWGVFSKPMLTKELIISVFIMGLAWSFIYKKSRSLVLPYFSHLLVDVFNCSVLAFVNLFPIIY